MVWRQESLLLLHAALCPGQPQAACPAAGTFVDTQALLATSAQRGVADLFCSWLQNNFFYGRKLLICTFFEK